MKRFSNILIIVLLLLVLMALTNPGQEQFVDWAIEEWEAESETELERILGSTIGRPVLQAATNRDDYIFFSVFTVEQSDEDAVYLGLLRFIFFRIPFL